MDFNRFFNQQDQSIILAGIIVGYLTKEAFVKLREKWFRDVLNFSSLEQIEQDRIFNELVVTAMSLTYLSMEAMIELNPHEESKRVFQNIKNNLAVSYVRLLREQRVEPDLCDLWYRLLAMRCEEYRKDYDQHKDQFSNPRENPWVPISAVGGSSHICRGDDSKIKMLLPDFSRWIGKLNLGIQNIIFENSKKSKGQCRRIQKNSLNH